MDIEFGVFSWCQYLLGGVNYITTVLNLRTKGNEYVEIATNDLGILS